MWVIDTTSFIQFISVPLRKEIHNKAKEGILSAKWL